MKNIYLQRIMSDYLYLNRNELFLKVHPLDYQEINRQLYIQLKNQLDRQLWDSLDIQLQHTPHPFITK